MSNIQKSEVKYFDATEGDFNDVYDRFYIRGTWEQVEEYIKSCFNENEPPEDIASGFDIGYGYYYPVTDDDGNEVPESDPRYEELNDMQEARLRYYITAVPMEEEDLKFVDKEKLHDLTSVDKERSYDE